MDRALLIVNPDATSVTPWKKSLIAKALSSDFRLELVETKARGHATWLARQAAEEGYALVAALGGDGTVNEALNGLVGSETALGILPGGSTNVVARVLGIPTDVADAAGFLLSRWQAREWRRVNLGRAGGRYFFFCAGVGFDAAVVRAVEERPSSKRIAPQGTFILQAFRVFFTEFDRRTPSLTLEIPGAEPVEDLFTVMACKVGVWTYLRNRPLRLCPDANLEGGLDAIGFRSLGLFRTVRSLLQIFTQARHIKHRHVRYFRNLDSATVRASRPAPFQLDGDYLGEVLELPLGVAREALLVLA